MQTLSSIYRQKNERARRRYKELKKMRKKVKFKDILNNLKRRDKEDRSTSF